MRWLYALLVASAYLGGCAVLDHPLAGGSAVDHMGDAWRDHAMRY